MVRQKKVKKFIFLLLLFVSIGFALLSTSLSIMGVTFVKKNKWDVHFDNVQVLVDSKNEVPVISNAEKTEVTYNVVLEKPGDYYEFTVDVVNGGTIDAMIDKVQSTVNGESVEEALPSVLEYSVTYVKDYPIKVKQLLPSKQKLTYKIRLAYKKDIQDTDLSLDDLDLSMSFSVDYVQADESAIPYNQHETTESTLDSTKFNSFGKQNNPTEVIFVNTGVDDSDSEKYVDISSDADKSILAWMDNETMYVSAREKNLYVKAPKYSYDLIGGSSYSSWYIKIKKVDVSKLDISLTTTISGMFENCGYDEGVTTFEIVGLDEWDTSHVVNMARLFENAGSYATTFYIGDLSMWNTSSVVDMDYMFDDAGRSATTWSIGDLGGWNTSSVTSMNSMFYCAGYSTSIFDVGNLGNWDISKVYNVVHMFDHAGFNATTWNIGNLSNWNTSEVNSMRSMFAGAGYNSSNFYIGDLSKWDTKKVKTMEFMFQYAGKYAKTWNIGDIGGWDTSSVTSMESMFEYTGDDAITWNIGDLSNWDTSEVKSMESMFRYTGGHADTWDIGDLSSWDTHQVISMGNMFLHTGDDATTWNVGDLSNWDTENVLNMSLMFACAGYSATSFKLDLSNWNTSSVNNMNYMFSSAGYNATNWSIGNISSWNTNSVNNMSNMFSSAGYNAQYSLNLSSWNVESVTSHNNFNRDVEDKVIPPVWVS